MHEQGKSKTSIEEIEALRTIREYCRERFKSSVTLWDRLEQKAGRTAGYSGIYAGISVFLLSYVAAEYQQNDFSAYALALFTVSTACFLASTFCSLSSQKITEIRTPPRPRDVLRWFVSDEGEEKTESRVLKLLSMKYTKAFESMEQPIAKKARLIKISVYLQICGLISIGIFVLAALAVMFDRA